MTTGDTVTFAAHPWDGRCQCNDCVEGKQGLEPATLAIRNPVRPTKTSGGKPDGK